MCAIVRLTIERATALSKRPTGEATNTMVVEHLIYTIGKSLVV
jgi:hypothetical protein